MYANEVNRRHHIDKKMQNDFLINTIRPQKRKFSKWIKTEKSDDIECLKLFYGFSEVKAREVLSLLVDEDIRKIKEMTDIGGLRK
jgi:hypothetical protein